MRRVVGVSTTCIAAGGAAALTLALTGCAFWPVNSTDDPTKPADMGSVELNVVVDETHEYTDWSEAESPDYYRIVGSSQLDAIPDQGSATYAPLDDLGRAGRVVACVDFDMKQAGRERDREDLRDVLPSGWGHNEEVDIDLPNGSSYHGQFWNRSHLLAKSLGGADIAENLVCGTRMQNVGSNRADAPGGMAFCENLARSWLESNPTGWVAYAATPIYEGDELVCRSVMVDILSSDGSLDLRVEVYNAAKDYVIYYATGEFRLAP